MPTITTTPATFYNFPIQTVEKIQYLGHPGGWVTVPHLYCDKLKVACNAYDEAELSYQIGDDLIQPGTSVAGDYVPLTLRGYFVRITFSVVPSNVVWVGYVLTDDVIREGVKNSGGVNTMQGRAQLFKAVGLAWFLDRKQITQAVVRNTGATPDTVTIERPLTFNGGLTADIDPSSAIRGNRSQAVGTSNVYEFTDSFDGAPLWTARQIVDHCLYYYTLRNSLGTMMPKFFLEVASQVFLDGFTPTIRSEGLTVFQVLNKICTPQRGLVWWVSTENVFGLEQGVIYVQSIATAAVTLPSTGTLPANTNQQTLDFDADWDVSGVKYSQVGYRDYHQVVVRGARMTTTCTLGLEDHTLIEDWSQSTDPAVSGTEKKYKEAAKGDADYAGLDTEKKKKRNDAFRKNDALHRVYGCFRVPSTWDGKTGDGSGSTRDHALPILSDTGSITGGLAKNIQGFKMLNTLRIKRGWDYSNPLDPKSNTPSGSVPELAPPFAFLKVATSPDLWQYVDKCNRADWATGSPVSPNIKTTYHLFMQHAVPGIRVQANGGMQHALAKWAWAQPPTPEPTEADPELDYRYLRATVCLEADKFCEGVYPDAGFPANTPLQVLTIDAGEHYRLDFIAKNTVVGINSGALVKASDAARLRDDRVYLRDLAKLAYQWYQENRYTLSVAFRNVHNYFALGMMITTIGSLATQQNVNTVVSSITYDMIHGTTVFETEDQTLDIRSLVV